MNRYDCLRKAWLVLLFLFLPAKVGTGEQGSSVFQSGPVQVPLIELFSSEGCSSCPPADRWMSRLQGAPNLWKEFVPVAFHVDYWDRLGWVDRFASPEFTKRQKSYSKVWRSSSTYTPGFVWNGKEWRQWFRSPALPQAPTKEVGNLVVRQKGGDAFQINFSPVDEKKGEWMAHAALLGFGIQTKVGAGENGGRTLAHDFIVLSYEEKEMALNGKQYSSFFKLMRKPELAPERYGIAVWVAKENRPVPIQAAGGFLSK